MTVLNKVITNEPSPCSVGVDEVMIVVLKFSQNRIGLCMFSIGVPLPNDATVSGTKGTIRVRLKYLTL